jgi:hypothetical protein
MKAEGDTSERAAGKGGWLRKIHWSTIVAAVAAVALAYLAMRTGRTWHTTRATVAALDARQTSLTAENIVLERAFPILRNQKFDICNKTEDTLTVPWVSVAYHDGRQLRQFDSARCQGWKPQVLKPGERKAFTFSSSDDACNWSGAVMLYAFNYLRESEETINTYNATGQWTFDPCFLVE